MKKAPSKMKLKKKIKVIIDTISPFFYSSLILIIIIFLCSKFTGFEGHTPLPGSSTVGHPLITSYLEGLKYWLNYLILFLIVFFVSLLLFGKLQYKDVLKKNMEKDNEKEKLDKVENTNESNYNGSLF